MPIAITCEECGSAYSVKPYRAKKSRFCSFECAGRYRARETLNVGTKPHMIGNKLRVGLRPANAFKPGMPKEAHPKWEKGLQRTCEHCAKNFWQKQWLARQNGLARFCGRKCFEASEVFVAEKSASYVGGITTYRGKGWLDARNRVVTEQCGNCGHCGKHVGKSLPVHHIVPFRKFTSVEAANARDNLIGLCQSCHMKEEMRCA